MLRLSISTGGQYMVLYKQRVVLRTADQVKAENFINQNDGKKYEEIFDLGLEQSDMKAGDKILFKIDLSEKSSRFGAKYGTPNNFNHGYVFRTTSGAFR